MPTFMSAKQLSGNIPYTYRHINEYLKDRVFLEARLFPDMLPMVFAKSELEARDWISAQRTKLLNNPSRT